MRAKNLEDVVVYHRAQAAADAVSALLDRPAFRRDFDLTDQLSRSSSRVAPLIAEGFGQLTDRHLAVYLGRARGSCLETKGHLRKAFSKRYISEAELLTTDELYNEIGKRLTRWINYLQATDWKTRR
jgi:four helix bundle protein